MRYKKIGGVFLILILFSNSAQAGDFLNQHLPEYLKADIEFRYRMEYKNNFDFDKGKDDADAYNLYRTRVNLAYIPIKQATLFIQGQDARVSNLSTGTKSNYENLWDIRQLYAKYEDKVLIEAIGLNRIALQGGRQEFVYGAERLIGAFNWSNVAQTFDGGRAQFYFAPYNLQLDIFSGDKTGFRSPQDTKANDLFGASTRDRVYAYYATAKAFHETII